MRRERKVEAGNGEEQKDAQCRYAICTTKDIVSYTEYFII